MNPRTFEIIEEVSTQGIWTWLEVDKNSGSLYLEFDNFKLIDGVIKSDNSYQCELAIRFGDNLSLSIFYEDILDLEFLNFKREIIDEVFNSNLKITDKIEYFYREFSIKISKIRFQDYELLKELNNKFKNKKILIGDGLENFDFLIIISCEKFAISVGANFVNCFNDFESLNDDDIKRLSNNWILYYLDYWDKKGTCKEYKLDLLCEEFPFEL